MFQTTGGIPARQGLKYVGFELDQQCWNVKNTTSEGNQRVLVSQRALPYKRKTRSRHTTKFYINQLQIKRIGFLFYCTSFPWFKCSQARAKIKQGLKLSPVGLICVGLRAWKAHQILNVISKPIHDCSWASEIRGKPNAIGKPTMIYELARILADV